MISSFMDMIEDKLDVFMDEYFVCEDSFIKCLTNLVWVLERCEDTNLVLNWEKCHFMINEGIVRDTAFLRKGWKWIRLKLKSSKNYHIQL